jgi:hypothetical protein
MRSALSISEGDSVEFELEDSTIRLRPRKGSIVERTKGMMKSLVPPMTAEEERVATETAIAEEAEERARR